MLKYDELIDLLVSNIEGMKARYDNALDCFGDCELQHHMCDCEFVPYIIEQLEKGNERKLKRAFEVIEYIYAHGDRNCVYVANVSITETLCNLAHEKYGEKIISLCGPVSKEKFTRMLD